MVTEFLVVTPAIFQFLKNANGSVGTYTIFPTLREALKQIPSGDVVIVERVTNGLQHYFACRYKNRTGTWLKCSPDGKEYLELRKRKHPHTK